MATGDSAAPQKDKTGRWGEEEAEHYLAAEGYAILERNWRMGRLELDIVAQKGGIIAFVEVKTRRSMETDPSLAVDKRKRARMITAADTYLKRYQLPFDYRFDIISISGTPESYTIEHLPDAFMPALRSLR
ncbi:MAG: YraN family protein [Lachnospiraceae bacterium]|nr:YraN family protein [Lachnospiraceae bacterium]